MFVGTAVEGRRSPFSLSPSVQETERWKAQVQAAYAEQARSSSAREEG